MTTETTGTPTVQVAFIYRDEVSYSWHESMWEMFSYDRDHGRHLHQRRLAIRTHPIRMVQSRNLVVKAFLDDTDAEWLLWIDTDMGWRPDALERLLAAADPVKAPMVGGLCFGLWPTGYDGMGGLRFDVRPTLFRIATRVKDGAPVYSPMPSYPDDTVVEVHATGSAFVLIHRTVFEKVRAEHGDRWYDQIVDGDGETMGEDISFCLRVGALGLPMFVDTGTPTSHHKQLWLGEQDFWAQHAEQRMANPAPDLPIFTHLPATFDALARNRHDHDGMLKFHADLDRYLAIIYATKPEVIVETGTRTGASARWFGLNSGADVITVDVSRPADLHEGDTMTFMSGRTITFVTGDAADPEVAAKVAELVAGRRCMVTLDSDHSGPHVAKEIDLYGPLVTPGCYLVVEDTIFGYGEDAKAQHGMADIEGSPLDAVLSHLVGNPEWLRDVAIEQSHPIGSNPAGWWIRNG